MNEAARCPLLSSGCGAGEVKKVVGLVGKGVTFDSGGYNLKVGARSCFSNALLYSPG